MIEPSQVNVVVDECAVCRPCRPCTVAVPWQWAAGVAVGRPRAAVDACPSGCRSVISTTAATGALLHIHVVAVMYITEATYNSVTSVCGRDFRVPVGHVDLFMT